MLHIQSGDRIELFDENGSATTIRATVGRLLTDREEGLGPEADGFFICWVEITLDEPAEMEARQVVLVDNDFQYWLNGRRVTLRKTDV